MLKRHFFVPEVVQTSATDCGPAALKAILEGFNISVSYGRLREACQTDVDGTSIDTIEDIATQLGLKAEQVMVPPDHLLLPESNILPAIVVVGLPNGFTHFVVVWSLHGAFVQVMDPASGRRWLTRKGFLEELYLHTQAVPASMWREWASSDGLDPLRHHLNKLGGKPAEIEQLIDTASKEPTWVSLATLDAATRMVTALVRSKALKAGEEAMTVLERLFQRSLEARNSGTKSMIPTPYWSVQASSETDPETSEEIILVQGAVLVRVLGTSPAEKQSSEQGEDRPPLSPELAAALKEPPSRPELEIWRLLRLDGFLIPSIWALSLALTTGGVLIETLLLRGILDVGRSLELVGQRIGAISMVFAFMGIVLLLEIPILAIVQRIGRRLETRLRIAFLEKIPRLGDRYFRSRLTSDMTQRAYDIRQVRNLPFIGINFLRLSFQLILTACGVIWLDPFSAPLAILSAIFAVVMSFFFQPVLIEQDLRLNTHKSALSHFYLDALLGLVPIRTHGAERAMRREHEGLLVKWVHTIIAFYQTNILIDAMQACGGLAFSVLILFNYIAKGGDSSGVLLLFYWSLNLPALGRGLASIMQQYPSQRNLILRLFEPLGAPEEESDLNIPVEAPSPTKGMAIKIENVTVQAGGHIILNDINLHLKAGEHVAMVGSSGAGKSSLVGMLLGWHHPSTGQILIDGVPLNGEQYHVVRQQTAWVDPTVQLWNRSLLDNLRYGNRTTNGNTIDMPIEQANLFAVLEKLSDGLQTLLGERGGLVSGGEGQRVRLGRALARSGVRLVILDEPFRGLDRTQRRELLARARQHWQEETLIFISHDVAESQTFERVLVMEKGYIIEDDTPTVLAAQPNSRYLALLQAEESVRLGMWDSKTWRRLWLENGQLREIKKEIKN